MYKAEENDDTAASLTGNLLYVTIVASKIFSFLGSVRMHVYREPILFEYKVTQYHMPCSLDHWHLHIEFVYVLSGACEIIVGKTKRLCSAGDFAVVHSGEIHSILNVQNSNIYVCRVHPEVLYSSGSDVKFLHNFISKEMLSQAGITDEIRQSFTDCLREQTKQERWNDFIIKSTISRMYWLLVRHFENTSREKPKTVSFQQFQKTMLYMEEHYNEDITLESLAEITNYNPAYLSSMFVRYAGVNFKKYLDNIRVNKAIWLINHTKLKISNISALCGFNNIRTFNNVFRAVTGMTPRQFRNSNLSQKLVP